MSKRPSRREDLTLQVGRVFSPAAPIREKDVFMGRTEQLRTVMDAINQQGQHVLIYGERGVGKTSLANVLAGFLQSMGQVEFIAPHINCESTDDFSSIWRKVFKQVQLSAARQGMGFGGRRQLHAFSLTDELPETIAPDVILSISLSVLKGRPFIPIIDEFDRLEDKESARQFTDTIKVLSDQSPQTTLILVGVADTVETLIAEHQSVERCWCRSSCRACLGRNSNKSSRPGRRPSA